MENNNESQVNTPPTEPVPAVPVTRPVLAPVWQTVRQAWREYASRWELYLSAALLSTVPVLLWSIFAVPVERDGQVMFSGPAQVGLFLALLVVVIVGGLVSQVMISILALRRSEEWGFGRLMSVSFGKVLGVLLISVLTGLFVMLGFVAFIIPGIILSVTTAFGSYAYLDQGIKGWAAVTKSREYVKGYWWAVFGRLAAMLFLVVLVFLVVTMPFKNGSVASDIANSIANLIVTPFAAVYIVLVYEQLRAIKGSAADSSPPVV